MNSKRIDLSLLPESEDAQGGYEEIHGVWEKLFGMVSAGKHPNETDLEELIEKAKYVMTGREIAFMDTLKNSLSDFPLELRHTKLSGGLSKVLMDRHGFKVSKEGGGLG